MWCGRSTTSAATGARGWSTGCRGHAAAPSSARSTVGSTIWTAPCAARRGPESFEDFDRDRFQLKPIEMEVFHGFIFLRFEPGPQPAVADLLAPFAADFAAYRNAGVGFGRAVALADRAPVNWKSVRDVDNEGYHVPLAIPACRTSMAATTPGSPGGGGINFSRGVFGDRPGGHGRCGIMWK